MKVLVTDAAGFIGFHTAQALLARGDEGVGLDNLNAYYDPGRKSARLALLTLNALPTTGLRFFTVYGPWGRPIDVFDFGRHQRDCTCVDDIVQGVVGALDHVAAADPAWNSDQPNPATSCAPYRIYNIGNQNPVSLLRHIEVLEQRLGRRADKNLLPLRLGDVPDTWADVEALAHDVGYRPATALEVGVRKFVDWYLDYNKPP
jgi:UDP-glucuronate 4-epimerase